MPDPNPSITPPEPPFALDRTAEATFLLLAAVLPWAIAPMGIATALSGAVTLVLIARGGSWPRTPVDLPALGWALALLLSALLAEDRAASIPRLGKALF